MKAPGKRDSASFLNPEPPATATDSAALFVDRTEELEKAIEKVHDVVGGAQCTLLAVVGLARVGKSHFLQQLAASVKDDFQAFVRLRVAQGVTDTASVLREILSRVVAEIHNAIGEKGIGQPEGPSPLIPLEQFQHRFAEAINGRRMQISTTNSIAVSLAKRVGGSAKLTAKLSSLWSILQPFDVGGELSLQYERSSGRTDTDTVGQLIDVPPFTEEQLCELIGWAHTLVREAAQPFQTLLVIDDFDLLARRPDDNTLNPLPLLQSLYSLAQFDGLHVLTTVREDTFEIYDKNFCEVAYIAPFSDVKLLLEIYQKHVTMYHAGEPPLPDELVRAAAERCEGRVGIFLKFLHRVANRYRGSLSLLQFSSYMDQQWRDMKQRIPAAVDAVERAVRESAGVLPADQARELRKSAMMRLLFEDYSSESNLTVDPILRSFLRERFVAS